MSDETPTQDLPSDGLRRVVADLERRRSLFKTINDFALKLLGIPTRGELAWYVAREVVGRLGYDDCVVYLVDPERALLRQVAAIGAKNPRGDQIVNALEIPIGQGITGHVAETAQPAIVDDLRADGRYIADVEPALSEICVPLLADGEVIGVIDCEDPRPGHFGPEHLEILTTVAAMTSAKLQMIDEARRAETRNEELLRLNARLQSEIEERSRTEDRLREREEQLGQAAQLAKLGYYVWDAIEDRCQICSEQHARHHGLTPEAYIAQASALDGSFSLTHPDDREAVRAAMVELRAGKTFAMEYRVVTPAGEVRHLRELIEPIFDESGRVVREIGSSQDITEEKAAEARLRQAQKMEALGQLTGGVAHDFNNLLTVIRGNAELLAETSQGDDAFTEVILRAAARGAELTQRLLAFSRRQPLRPQSVDLAALVAGMSGLLRRSLGETVAITTKAELDLWPALADPGQLENAVLNLAINARDAMAGGGSLIIDCMNLRLDPVMAGREVELPAGDYVALEVSDSGQGMTPEVRERAFEPFFTTKDVGHGSGLGLSMVYGFAKQSGGHVTIYGEPGRGTAVRIYLPRAKAASAPRDIEAADAMPPGRGEMILVIEDDEDVRALAVRQLEGLGYRTITAPRAAPALAILDGGAKVDLVLSDVVLPGGVSGPELAADARRRHPGLKVIFMSGYTAEAARRSGLLESGETLLNKPFRKKDLARAVRRALD